MRTPVRYYALLGAGEFTILTVLFLLFGNNPFVAVAFATVITGVFLVPFALIARRVKRDESGMR